MKAGGLARFATPAQVVSLILSDVIGDPLEFIASGPTYVREEGDSLSPIARALAILEKHNLRDKVSALFCLFAHTAKRFIKQNMLQLLQ